MPQHLNLLSLKPVSLVPNSLLVSLLLFNVHVEWVSSCFSLISVACLDAREHVVTVVGLCVPSFTLIVDLNQRLIELYESADLELIVYFLESFVSLRDKPLLVVFFESVDVLFLQLVHLQIEWHVLVHMHHYLL